MYRLIVVAVVVFALWRTASRFRQGDLTVGKLLAWSALWLGVLVLGLQPQVTDVVSRWAGIERGATLFMFLAILFLLYVVFALHVRMEKMQQEVTKLVREISLRDLTRSEGGEAKRGE